MRRTLSFVLTALVLATPRLGAQTGSLTGTVVNATTRAPIDGAQVRVLGANLVALTNDAGRFTIAGVPPGVHVVTARRVGFATLELSGVEIEIARTRTLVLTLRPVNGDTTDRVIYAPPPLETPVGPTSIPFSRDQLTALPTLTLSSALGVSGGYLDLPRSSVLISPIDIYRGILTLGSVRAGRPEATQYLLDGISVNNPVYGTPPLLVEPFASAGITLMPAHVDAEYGGAVAGVVAQSIRTGDERVNGGVEYQSTNLASKLGDKAGAAGGSYLARAYISGPVPFGRNTLRFMFAAHTISERLRVTRLDLAEYPHDTNIVQLARARGIGTGWSGRGDLGDNQIVGKLSYDFSHSLQVSLAGIARRRIADDVDPTVLAGDTIAHPTVRDDGTLVIARIQKRFSHASAAVSYAISTGERSTCSIWEGVCVAGRLNRIPTGDEVPAFPVPPSGIPYVASGQYYGGESYRSRIVRADFIAKPSDHHELQLGVYTSTHRLAYSDVRLYRWLQGDILTSSQTYRAHPVEFSSYIQDAISHDIMTVHIGARFDYGNTGGFTFVNPLDPNNGTTAVDVCNGEAPGLNTTPFTYGTFKGYSACVNAPAQDFGRSALLDSATRLAATDDMRRTRPRASFSPRIGFAFPLTETSGMFVNYGRFTRQPVYHDAYRYTGTGSIGGMDDGDGMCESYRTRAATGECTPFLGINSRLGEFVGNPSLDFEQANILEAGFTSRAGQEHSLAASVYKNDQSHLPRFYAQGVQPDAGLTYGIVAGGNLRTVLSTGSSSLFGVSVTLRRRRQGAMQYVVTYAWQRATEIGAMPDLAATATTNSVAYNDRIERASPLNRTHTLNALVSWQWMERSPEWAGVVGRVLLKNSRTTVTASAASGSQQRGEVPADCNFNATCSALARGIEGTGTLANAMYVKSISTGSTRVAFIARVQNILNADDGTGLPTSLAVRFMLPSRGTMVARVNQRVSFRRVFTGLSVRF